MKKEEILAVCIEEIESGKSTIDECVKRHPEMGKELRSMLALATSIKLDAVKPTDEFKLRAKRRLFVEMQPAPAKPRLSWAWPNLMPARILASVLLALIVLAVAGGGTVYAAQNSLPGDTLYPVKTGVENVQVALTPSAADKADLYVRLAQRRVDELTEQVKQNRDISPQTLDKVEARIDDAVKSLGDSRDTDKNAVVLDRLSAATLNQQIELEQALANAPQTSRPALEKALDTAKKGNIIADIASGNQDYLKTLPSVKDKELDTGKFKMDGTVLSIQGKTWNIGGVVVENVVYSGRTPSVGSRVKVEGIVKDGKTFISRLDVSEQTKSPIRVEGEFGGATFNGTASVGGLSVQIIKSGPLPELGDEVRAQGTDDKGNVKITQKRTAQPEVKNTPKLSGVLSAVNTRAETISVKSSGRQVFTVNISDARIQTDSGRTIRPNDLSRYTGKDVNLEGLTNKGSLIFVKLVTVED